MKNPVDLASIFREASKAFSAAADRVDREGQPEEIGVLTYPRTRPNYCCGKGCNNQAAIYRRRLPEGGEELVHAGLCRSCESREGEWRATRHHQASLAEKRQTALERGTTANVRQVKR